MNPLDRLLRKEMSRCLERIAGPSAEGPLPCMTTHQPGLRSRLEEAEGRLAGLRSRLLEDYLCVGGYARGDREPVVSGRIETGRAQGA